MIRGSTKSAPARVTTPVIPEHDLIRAIASGSYGEVWLARSALGAYSGGENCAEKHVRP
jgi:hypothetical protein